MRTLHFHGSHGTVTACAVSGHIIHADACDCEDCAEFGGYESIALVDVPGCDPAAIANGGGDILSAALIYRDGGYCRACARVDDGEWSILEELPRLPAPDPAHRTPWNESPAHIAHLVDECHADAIEVAGCFEDADGAFVERVDGDACANLWSVYLHFPNEWEGDPNGLRGAVDIADRGTRREALETARAMGAVYGLPVHDFT